MNNPQHYQPLAHALHPPSTASSSHSQSSYNPSSVYHSNNPNSHNREEEEEDDENDNDPDDGDEDIVEEQLDRSEPDGPSTSLPPHSVSSNGNVQNVQTTLPEQSHEPTQEPGRKRKPGRPRGSKNRKPRAASQGTARQDTNLNQPLAVIPQHTDANTQLQQFYEFQWRILNLCAEFYGAAEELVKSTPPAVLAQCYQTGPGGSNDPLKMLTDAKMVCDNLLANPSRLAMSPPTPNYSNLSSVYQTSSTQSPTSSQSNLSSSTLTNKATTPMITNPQSFVVPLSAQATYPHMQYPVFPTAATQYPATYYHQYPYAPSTTTTFYSQQHILTATQPQTSLQTQAPAHSTATVGTLSSIASTGFLNQGAWSEEETEKLKKLAEESRTFSSTGEIDWDWVVTQYGNSRTRHQILIKATALSLKESSSRGVKRRREIEDDAGPVAPPPPSSNMNSTSTTIIPTSASPAHSHTTSTSVDSPALQNQQRPPASKGSTLASTPSSLPWPMPTVAANSSSPVITASTISQDQQQTSYYRPQDTTKPLTHNYMYQPTNGTGSRLNKENGK